MTSEGDGGPLAYATTSELLDELMGRFSHCLFGGIVEAEGVVGNERYKMIRRWSGNSATVAGLGLDVGRRALEVAEASAEDCELDDEGDDEV